jgi:PRTRC genetic system protein C
MMKTGNLEVTPLIREFIDSKTNAVYSDPNSSWTPDQVRDFMANQYPHLLNAKIEGPDIGSTKIKYKFTTTIGTKG